MTGIDYSRWADLDASSEEEDSKETSGVSGLGSDSERGSTRRCECCEQNESSEGSEGNVEILRAVHDLFRGPKGGKIPLHGLEEKLEALGSWFAESESAEDLSSRINAFWGPLLEQGKRLEEEKKRMKIMEGRGEHAVVADSNGGIEAPGSGPGSRVERNMKQKTLLYFYSCRREGTQSEGKNSEGEEGANIRVQHPPPHHERTGFKNIPEGVDELMVDGASEGSSSSRCVSASRFGYWMLKGKLFEGGKMVFHKCPVFYEKENFQHRQEALLSPVREDQARRIATGHPDPMKALDRAAAPCLKALRNAHCPFDGPLLHLYCLGGSAGDSLEVFRRCPTTSKLLRMGPLSMQAADNAIHNLKLSVTDLPRLVLLSLDHKLHELGHSILKSKKQMNAKGSARKKYFEVFAPIHAIRSLAELGEGGGGLLPLLDVDIPLELWDPAFGDASSFSQDTDLLAQIARDPLPRYLVAACVNEQVGNSCSNLWGGVLQSLLAYATDSSRWLVGRMRALVAADCLFAWDLDPLLPESQEHKGGLPFYLVGEGRRISKHAREHIVLTVEKILSEIGKCTQLPLARQAIALRAWSWSTCSLCRQSGGGGPACHGCGRNVCFRCIREDESCSLDGPRTAKRWCHLCVGQFDAFPTPVPAPKRASLDYIDAVDLMDKGMMDRFKGKTLKMLWVTAGLFELNEDRTVSNDLLPIKWDSVCDKMYEPMLLNSNIVFYGDDNDELETLGSFSSSSKYAPNILIQVSEQVDEMVDIIMGHGSEGWNLLAKRYKRLVSAIDHHMANTAALHSPLGNSASLERLLEVSGASASKSHGTQLFKQGKYLPALVAYADAISAVVVLCVSAAVFGAEVDPQTGVPVVSPSGMQSTITFANMTLPLYLACLLNAALIGNILCKEENISKFGDRWEQEDLAMASCRCCDIALELLGVDYFNSSPDCRNGMYTRSPSLLPSGIVAGCSIKMWIAKALFRRGQALVFLGALEQAEADLRAAEALVPMDRAISEERETVTRARAQLLSPEERKRERARRKKEKKKAKTRHLDASILVQTQEAVLQASHSPSSEIDLPQSRSSDLCLEFSEKAPEALKDICSEERRKEKQRKKKERRKAKKGHQQLVPQTIDDHEEMERNGAVSAEKEVLKAEAGENEERLRQEKLKAKREKREAIKAQRRAEAEAAAAAKKKRQQVEEARKQAAQDCIAAAEAAHKAAIERARQIAAIEEKEREELLQARQKELETLRDAELKSEKVEQAKSPADLGPITHALEEEDVPRRICENVNVETDYVDGVVPEKEFSQSDSGKSELSRMCAPILSGNQRSAELQKHGPYEEAQSSDRLQEVDSNHSAEYLLHGGKFLSKPSWDNVTEITASLSADEVDAITFGEDAVQERLNALKVTDLSNMASSSPDCCTTYFPTSSKWEDGSATQHFVEGVDNMQSAGAEVETVSSVVSALPGFQSRHDGLSVPVEEMINQIYNAEPFRQNLHDVDAPEHLNNASSMPVGLTASMEERDIFSRAMIDVQEQSRERAPSDERGIEGCPSKVYPSMQETQNIWSAALAPNCEHSASNGHNAYPQWSNGRVPAELCQGFTWQRPELLTGAWDQSNANPDLKESLSWAPVDQNVGGNQGRPWPWSTPVDPCSGYNVPSANNFYPTGNDAYVDRNAWDQGQAWGTRRQEGNPMQTDNLCMLCRLRPKDALPVPCGHACACFECLSAVQLMPGQGQCPVCLVPIQRVQRVILS